MSKLRQDVPFVEGEIASPAESDLAPWVIFTQLKPGGPHVYAGWLDARDPAMALQFAREHYGQDQQCTSIWALPRTALAGTEKEYAASDTPGPRRRYQVFTRAGGANYASAGTVDAESSAAAIAAAIESSAKPPEGVWVAPADAIVATDDDDVIWRHTDQTYRLARGYSSAVREKWEKIRRERDIEDYERDDLKESF